MVAKCWPKFDQMLAVLFAKFARFDKFDKFDKVGQMLANVERQDAAFQKMKKTSGNETMQDKDKIRAQVKLDIEAIRAAACEMVGCATAESLVLPDAGADW